MSVKGAKRQPARNHKTDDGWMETVDHRKQLDKRRAKNKAARKARKRNR